MLVIIAKIFQESLIKEYTLNHFCNPLMKWSIPELRTFGISGQRTLQYIAAGFGLLLSKLPSRGAPLLEACCCAQRGSLKSVNATHALTISFSLVYIRIHTYRYTFVYEHLYIYTYTHTRINIVQDDIKDDFLSASESRRCR